MKAVSLSDVCFKPNGNICAIESVLQYWQMSQTKWEKKVKEHNGAAGAAGYCFAHWTTGGSSDVSCMSKFLGPVGASELSTFEINILLHVPCILLLQRVV